MMFKSIKGWFTPPDLLARFYKVNLPAQKIGVICFLRICFPGIIFCDQEPLWLLNAIEDDCYFLGVHTCIRLLTRWKICFTLGLLANYHSLKSLSLSLKCQMKGALKLTDLWTRSFCLIWRWSAGNCSIFPTVNIFRLFRSKKRTGRGNQRCLKNWNRK